MLDAANPDLPDTQPLTSAQADDQVAGRPYLPALIGLPDDNRVRIVDTAAGRVVQTSPAGGQVLAEARTEAKVFATGPSGLIAVDGRDMAYLPFR